METEIEKMVLEDRLSLMADTVYMVRRRQMPMYRKEFSKLHTVQFVCKEIQIDPPGAKVIGVVTCGCCSPTIIHSFVEWLSPADRIRVSGLIDLNKRETQAEAIGHWIDKKMLRSRGRLDRL